MATACLHNICIDQNVPLEDDEDDGAPDNFAPIQVPADQPAQYVQLAQHLGARQAYIDRFFIPPFQPDQIWEPRTTTGVKPMVVKVKPQTLYPYKTPITTT